MLARSIAYLDGDSSGLYVSVDERATFASSGCVLSTKRVNITTDPPGSLLIILDEPGAPALLAAQDASSLTRRIVKTISPHMSPAAREALKKYDLAELIAQAVIESADARIPKEYVTRVQEALGPFSKPVVDKIFEMVGIKYFGVAPYRLKGKGYRTFAIIAWAPDRRTKVKRVTPLKSKKRVTLRLAEK